MEVRLAKEKESEIQPKDDSCIPTGVEDERPYKELDNAVPEVDMTGLTTKQKEVAQLMLKEE